MDEDNNAVARNRRQGYVEIAPSLGFTCNGIRMHMKPQSMCCSHQSPKGCSTKPGQFTWETAESKAHTIIGLASFAPSTRSFSLRGNTLNVH